MKAVVAWWDLAASTETVTSLRDQLADAEVERWARVPGLLGKVWLADADAQRWGAVMLWADDAPSGDLPPNRATELIGYPPNVRIESDVAAAVEHGAVTVPGRAR